MKTGIREELVALLPRLRRFAIGLTANLDEADDLVQAACERALMKQHQWEPGTRLDSWMYRIIQTIRIDNLRRSKHSGGWVEVGDLPESGGTSGQDLEENRDILLKAVEVMQQLPEEQRIVMLLVAVDGMSYREVAELLEIPVGTVMSRLFRARTRLLSLIETEPAMRAAVERERHEE